MFWIALFPQRSAHCWPLSLETVSNVLQLSCQWRSKLPEFRHTWCTCHATCVQVWNTDLQTKNVEVCVKWLRDCWHIGPDLEHILGPNHLVLPCFLDVRVMVSLKVLQLELSPPHTPHLSSCFEEPNTPSQPTFCSQMGGKFHLSHQNSGCCHTLTQEGHSPHTPHAHTRCGGPCMSSECRPGPLGPWGRRHVSLWTGNAGCSVC